MTERAVQRKNSRREILKLGGAAALGAAGLAALNGTRVKAAGSGDTTVMYFNPQRLTVGTLTAGAEVVIGPFPTPNQPFTSDSYIGIIGNLTAFKWGGNGFLAVRPHGTPFMPLQAQNLHYGGTIFAISNWFTCQFGPATAIGMLSDGMFILHNGGSTTVSYLIDLHGFLGPDQ